jgi:hypothetical protein
MTSGASALVQLPQELAAPVRELVGAQLPSSGSGPLDGVGETHTFGEQDVVLVTGRVPSQQLDTTQPAQEEPTESPLVVVAGLHAHTRRVDAHADGT